MPNYPITDIETLREDRIILKDGCAGECDVCGAFAPLPIRIIHEDGRHSQEYDCRICESCLVEAWRLLSRLQYGTGARTVKVQSETRPGAAPYRVFTGDGGKSPPHCTCFAFQYHERRAGEQYLCKHLRMVLLGEGMS